MNVLLLDVCHTLYKANTTFDFLDQVLAGNAQYQQLCSDRGGFLNRIKGLFSASDNSRQEAIALLAGFSEQELKLAVNTFVDGLVPVEETHQYLAQAQTRGSKVILLSASLDIVIDVIAERMGVDGAFSSTLGFENGVCTGLLTRDLAGTKTQVIKQQFDGEALEFLTDNYDDAACAALVKEFHPVYRNSNLRARLFWATQSTSDPITYD